MNKESGVYYRAALYLRLSRDDEGVDMHGTESNSITAQRELLQSYVKRQSDMEVYQIYADDGWSGANFDRPAFRKMTEDVIAGKINCIIVKDLSRLGRDYIEAGWFIQKTLPAFSVRFIALLDQYDSLTADDNERNLILPVKNFINDAYCRDISEKVKSHQKIKRENGAFIGAFPIYGYQRDVKDRNRLLPDAYAAGVVRMIFAWKLQGFSLLAIANRLNAMGILSPMEYKHLKGECFSTGFLVGILPKWSAVAVKRILTNEIYLGMMVQGKEERVNFKVKVSRKKPKEEWVRVMDTHPAIVAREDFTLVQSLLAVSGRGVSQTAPAHKYTGILYCADCGQRMIRRENKKKTKGESYYICAGANRGNGCSRHTITEKQLDEVLQTAIHHFLQPSWKHIEDKIKKMEVDWHWVMVCREEMNCLQKECDIYQKLQMQLAEDVQKGQITKEDDTYFKTLYQQRETGLRQMLKRQQHTQKMLYQAGSMAAARQNKMRGQFVVTGMDRNVLISFVQKILVGKEKRLHIIWQACRKEVESDAAV